MLISFSQLMIMFITLFTPGPNNALLASSGLNYGFRQSQPHIWGVVLGFFCLLIFSGTGLLVLIAKFSFLDWTLKILGVIFLFYLAYKIATTQVELGAKSIKKRIGFYHAFAFQFINPKGLMLAISVQSSFFYQSLDFGGILFVAVVYAGIGILSSHSYVIMGLFLGKKVRSVRTHQLINQILGLSLAITAIIMIGDDLLALI